VTLPELEPLAREGARLRWVAQDVPAVEAAAAQAEAALTSGQKAGAEERRLLGYLGNAYRLLGRWDDAVAVHERARDLALATGDPRAAAVGLVRLGESYRCADRYAEAESALREALSVAPPEVAHFALQHLGKTLLDRGAAAEAAARLEAALERRRGIADVDLIRSTERALDAARKAL
jgi:tetratricopeptide (TPR) repeat protein